MKIAVCDDEKSMLEQMEENLKEFETLFQIDCYTSGEALLDSGIYYDLIFLDIDMKGISGIDTARMLRRRDKKVKIVYVTAYEDFRDYAFSVHAFGYLVKPVKRESVHEMIREVLDYTEEETDGPRLKFQTEEGIIEKISEFPSAAYRMACTAVVGDTRRGKEGEMKHVACGCQFTA